MRTLHSLPAHIQEKIVVASNGCWMWTGAHGAGGYGLLTYHAEPRRAHRLVYELLVGPIPEGFELDHLCRTKLCVNPRHLEPVTHQVNMQRHFATAVTCKNGHPWTPGNTWRSPTHGRRSCRACNRERHRKEAA